MRVKPSKLRLAILLGMAVSCTEVMAVPSVSAETLSLATQDAFNNAVDSAAMVYPRNSLSNNTVTLGSTTGSASVPVATVNNGYGTFSSSIYGGMSETGAVVTGDVVTVNSGSKIEAVYGGYSSDYENNNASGAVTNNEVIINNTSDGIAGFVCGGHARNGVASNNTVILNGGITNWCDVGGYSDGTASANHDVSNNTVIVNGGTHATVEGGWSNGSGNAVNNTVTVNGGTIEQVSGGDCHSSDGQAALDGTAKGNTVVINNGVINEVSGGCGDEQITNNTVTIHGGTITNNVFGGKNTYPIRTLNDTIGNNASNNIVNIEPVNGLDLTNATLYGSGDGADSTITHDRDSNGNQLGNTLNIYGKNITAYNVANFTNINFYLPSTIQNKDTALTLTDMEGTDVSYSTVKAGIVGNANISKGDKIYLLTNANGLTTTGTTYGKLTEGVSLDYDLDVHQDGDSIVATIDGTSSNGGGNGNGGGTIKSQTKSLVETRTAAMGFINSGADFIDNIVPTIDKGTYEPFVQTDAVDMRYNTGSYSNVHGSHAMVGASRAIEKSNGTVYLAPFIEAGWGRYDSHFDGIRADGSIDYCGAGFLARRSYTDGLYYEGTLHYGKIRSSYNSNDLDGASNETYDLNTPYYGINLEVGKTKKLNDKDSMDIYGKYFYTRQSGDTANLSSGETYNFDNVTSNRVRLGARWTRQYNTSHQVYAGAAYEYEFSGSADADYKGYTTPDSSLKGSSGMFEVGYEILKNNKHPMSVDLALTGWVGKQQGVMPRASVKWYL